MYPLEGQKTDIATLNKVRKIHFEFLYIIINQFQAIANKDQQILMLKKKVEEATNDLIKQTDALDRMRNDYTSKLI